MFREKCPSCEGSGMQDVKWKPRECTICGGGGFIDHYMTPAEFRQIITNAIVDAWLAIGGKIGT